MTDEGQDLAPESRAVEVHEEVQDDGRALHDEEERVPKRERGLHRAGLKI